MFYLHSVLHSRLRPRLLPQSHTEKAKIVVYCRWWLFCTAVSHHCCVLVTLHTPHPTHGSVPRGVGLRPVHASHAMIRVSARGEVARPSTKSVQQPPAHRSTCAVSHRTAPHSHYKLPGPSRRAAHPLAPKNIITRAMLLLNDAQED